MSYQRPGTEQRTSGLSIAAVAFAILLPLVGLILGLVARAQAKRTGSPTAIATVAVAVGAVLSLIWTACIALVLWGGVTLFTDSAGSPAVPVPESAKTIVLEVTAQHELDAETMSAARAVVERHATTAGMNVLAVTESNGDSLVVAFDEDTPDALIDRFGKSLAAPAAVGFAQVFAVLPGAGGRVDGSDEMTPACEDLPFGSVEWNGFALVCDDQDETQYVFDAEPRLPGTAIEKVTRSGDILGVTLRADAAKPFEEWTAEVAAQADPGQIAILDVNGVMSAPVVQGALSGGEFQISGGVAADNEEIAERLRVMSAGISFRVDGAKVG